MHFLKYVLSLQLDMLQQENENVLEQVFSLPFERKNSVCFLIVADEENMNLCTCYSFEKPRENVKKQRPEQENLKDRSVSLFWYNSASCTTCFAKMSLPFYSLCHKNCPKYLRRSLWVEMALMKEC